MDDDMAPAEMEMGAPMDMEIMEVEKVNPTTVLAVLASQDDDVYPFDKIISSTAFQEKESSKKFAIKTTTYEQFLDGAKEDVFDFVLLTFMTSVSSDDLEMKADYYDYYTQVPIVHYAIVKKGQDTDELEGVQKYLMDTCDKRLCKGEPLAFADLADTASCADALITALCELADVKDKMSNTFVEPAFKKFDKDGNGTIDIEELEKLMTELGQPVNPEQLEVAMKELDLNGDGVIDLFEFSRWYFTGMKAYNGPTRSILQMRNQTSTIFDILAKEDILKMLHEDKTMTTHRIKVQFNEPEQAYGLELKAHWLGPFTEQMMQETENFKNELGAELKLKPGENPYFAYVTFEFAMKPGQLDKYAGYCDKLNQYFEENKPVDDSAQPYFKIYPANDKIIVKFLVKNMEKLDVKVPIGLREGLKDIDQYVNVKVVLGANAEEILQPDKPLFDQSLKGFSVQAEVMFLKKIKKALQAGLIGTPIGDKILEGLKMGGPAFSLSSNLKFELTFDNMEEVKKHPMASQALVTVDQLLQGIYGMTRDEVLNYTPQFEGAADQDKLNAHIAQNEYCKSKKTRIDVMGLIGEMIEDMDPDCKINARANIFDIGSAEVTIEGANYGQIVNLVYKTITYKFKKEFQEYIIADFNSASEEAKADAPMEMPMEDMM